MENNQKIRYTSIDLLRGIAITGMILCANIGFNSGLPAWMFHAQTPPPTYAFNPDVPGITWVDLVFPFFLFAMGAAFPLAMRRRMERGESFMKLTGSLIKRWVILSAFALVLGNAYGTWATTLPGTQTYIFMITVWLVMFMALVRIRTGAEGWRRHLGTAVNIAGAAMIAALAFIRVRCFNVALDKWSCDVIIMILANVALFGGLLWMLTKDNMRLRWLVISFIAAVKALDSYSPEVLSFVPSFERIGWFFRSDYLQYLLIALPGSVIGDMLMKGCQERTVFSPKVIFAGILAISAVILQLWGLFAREVAADFIITATAAAAYIALTWKEKNLASRIALIGWILLLAGIAFDPIDGGITKDHCNLSYLFTTGGMAALTTSFLLMLELGFGMKGKFLAGVGQNPMIAYTITSFLIGPVLALCGLLPKLDAISTGSQFWGIGRGIIITGLMMAGTYMFTRLKVFWKS